MKINWSAREVDVFLSLAETLSFRRTALQVHLSQSAVSGTVARLEEMLDVRLFERTTRTVQLTLAGEVFAEQTRFLRHQMEETVRRVQEVAQLQVGRIALAALPSLAAGSCRARLPGLLRSIRACSWSCLTAWPARRLTWCAPGAWILHSPLPTPPMPTWTTPRWCPTALCC